MTARFLLAGAMIALTTSAFAQTTSWDGFYAGVNVGAQLPSKGGTLSAVPIFAAPTFSTELTTSVRLANGKLPNRPAFIEGGGQVGYNMTVSSTIVVGLEADIQALSGRTSQGALAIGVPSAFTNERITSQAFAPSGPAYLGTVRGRAGYLVLPDLLVFGTGGYAYGGAGSAGGIVQQNFGGLPAGSFDAPYSASFRPRPKGGYAVGGGLEWAFAPGLSFKAEYIHYDLGPGRATTLLSNRFLTDIGDGGVGSPVTTAQLRAKTRMSGEIVRVGVNYHFNLF